MPKRGGVFKTEKRRKELSRQKNQEEKRKRRFHKGDPTPPDTEKIDPENVTIPQPIH